MPTPYLWFDTLKVWQTFKDVKGSWRKSEKNRFSFSYKSCSKVFSTSFTFKSSHERMEQRWQSWTQSASGCPLMATGRESWGFRGFGNKRDSWSRRRSSYARRFTYEMISLSNRLCRCEANRNSYGSLTDTPQILREHSMTFFFSLFTFWVFLTRPNRSSKIIHHMKSKTSKK